MHGHKNSDVPQKFYHAMGPCISTGDKCHSMIRRGGDCRAIHVSYEQKLRQTWNALGSGRLENNRTLQSVAVGFEDHEQ